MTSFINKIFSREHFALAFICLVWLGLVTDRAVMSVGMISLTISSLIETHIWKNSLRFIRFPVFPLEGFIINTFRNLKVYKYWALRFISSRVNWLLFLFIIPVILSGLWSQDLVGYWKVLIIKSPFLFLPFAIGSLKMIKKEHLILVMYFFIAVAVVSSLFVMCNYLLHFESINNHLLQGQPIPVPFKEHIRYSLIIALSIYILLVFTLWKINLTSSKFERFLKVVLLVWLVAFMHILSVRSGLFAMYFSLIPLTFSLIIKYRNPKLIVVIVLIASLLAILSISFIPSIKNRIAYMRWEIEHSDEASSTYASDAGRILSIKAGLKCFQSHPLIGVGAGDLKSEMSKVYDLYFKNSSHYNRQLPHNQLLYSGVQTGIFGIVAFLIGLFAPYLLSRGWEKPILSGFIFIAGSAFLWEHMLEVQIGVAFFVVWYLLLLKWESILYKDSI